MTSGSSVARPVARLGHDGPARNDDPGCFWQADLATAAAALAQVIVDVRPQVLVTYDENGYYGHPDHIQAHRVARAAIGLAASQGQWQVAKFYATAMPQSVAEAEGVAYFVPFVPDEQVTTEIDGTAYLAAKTAAMRAHATQIVVDSGRFALSSGRWQPLLGRSTTRCWPGPPARRRGAGEHDLFAGLDGR